MAAININDTLSMLQAIERQKAPANFLVETFFPNALPVVSSKTVAVEFRKGSRKLAPFITAGNGVNVARDGAEIRFYEPPMIGASRAISVQDVEGRVFGEDVLGTMTPEQRAAQLQAKDFVDLQKMIQNRKNAMAAEILTKGTITMNGYADDGRIVKQEIMNVPGFNNNKLKANWSAASANILGDIEAASEAIQEGAGLVPTVMICGKNIKKYMLGNTEIFKYLSVANRGNLAMMNFAPRITAPQAGYIGRIEELNLEMYSYMETYTDIDGTVKPFLGPDDVIIGIPGVGKQLYASVTLVDNQGSFKTYASEMVPKYISNEADNTMSLSMFSRCLLMPETVDDWYHIDASV